MLSELVAIARRGAQKAASGAPDVDEYSEVSSFVGHSLEERSDDGILDLKRRLSGRCPEALPWYLEIVRTLAGTGTLGEKMWHVVVLPVLVTPATGETPMVFSAGVLERMASALEENLDLGYGSLKLEPTLYSLEALQSVRPSQWHSFLQGTSVEEALGLTPSPIEGLGALIGRWAVATTDKKRLMLKLQRAMRQSRQEVAQWKTRTEALLSEEFPERQVRVYFLMQLQHAFTGMRLLSLQVALETAVKQNPHLKILKWFWDKPTELCWAISDTPGKSDSSANIVAGRAEFPEEQVSIPMERIKAIAPRLGLKLVSLN